MATKSSTFITSIAKLAQTFVDVVSSTDSSRPGQPGSYSSQVGPLFQPYYLPVWPYGYKYYSADPHVPPPPPPRTEASTSARQAEANPAGNPSRSRSPRTNRVQHEKEVSAGRREFFKQQDKAAKKEDMEPGRNADSRWGPLPLPGNRTGQIRDTDQQWICLLYTSDAADE